MPPLIAILNSFDSGKYDQSIEYLEQNLVIAVEIQDPREKARAMGILGFT